MNTFTSVTSYSSQNTRRKTVNQLLEELKNPSSTSRPKVVQLKPKLDIDIIRSQMRQKWKDPGYCNLQFEKAPILRAKLLNEWESERIFQAERSFKHPKNFKGYKFDQHSREFKQTSKPLYSQSFQAHLQNIRIKKEKLPSVSLEKINEKKKRILRMMTEGHEKIKNKRKRTEVDGYFGYRSKTTVRMKTIK